MDGSKDTLNDAALEQEIEALLSRQPSPDFVARVRSRVAEESMSRGWGWRWPIAAVGTAMTLVALGVALWQPQEPAVPSTNTPVQRAATGDVPGPLVIPPHDAPAAIPVPQPRTPVVAVPRRAIEIALPPVIIAENESVAFAALVADRRATWLEFSPSIARTKDDPIEVAKMLKVDPVTLEPIEIKPLVKVVELE